MYLIHGWLITKEDIIGLPRLKINLDSLEEEPNSYMEQINTWIRFLMFALIIFKIATNFVITLTLSRATYFSLLIQVVPDIAFGSHTRVVLDVGCRVASFGAYLLSRDVLTLSIAPKDVHENQIQFALERGVPAMVAAFATHQLLYPSQTFDIIHCLRCRINWTHDDEEDLTGNAVCHWYVSPDIAEAQFEPISRIILRDHGPIWFTTTGNLFQMTDPTDAHLVFVEPPNQELRKGSHTILRLFFSSSRQQNYEKEAILFCDFSLVRLSNRNSSLEDIMHTKIVVCKTYRVSIFLDGIEVIPLQLLRLLRDGINSLTMLILNFTVLFLLTAVSSLYVLHQTRKCTPRWYKIELTGNSLAVVECMDEIYSLCKRSEDFSCRPTDYMSDQNDTNEKTRMIQMRRCVLFSLIC